MARRNLLKSQIVKAWLKVEEQIAKEAEQRMLSGVKHKDPTSNLTEGSEEKKDRAPETAEIMAKKAGFGSKNTWRDAKLIVSEGTPDKIRRMDEGGQRNGISTIAKEIRAGAKDNERLGGKGTQKSADVSKGETRDELAKIAGVSTHFYNINQWCASNCNHVEKEASNLHDVQN